ncbi:unnamed protein product [Dovyalis caffra]|uniref:RRP12-like protein n=1 Tax=Dovyalis caffra TaxID=77055 RepID=A0AAV1SJR6_9ROSI|nr:unnamed protein product [Dovyalis caffra]
MEGIEFDAPLLSSTDDDFCDSILSRYSTSIQEDHQHLCAIVGTMSQELKDQNLPFGAVVSGLKCVANLLSIRDSVNWTDISQPFGILLSFMTDSRIKVRRQSHLCIRDTLQSFQGTPALSPASESITNAFEKFLLLAGGSNEVAATDGPKGAQQVLYVLDALKECLPLLSIKCVTTILKYFKTLLELRQPVVTRRVTDILNVICLHPSLEVPAEPLLDLLCSLALYASTNETSADNMTFTARLLDVGMGKVYSLNRQICVVKLPIVFSTLKDILASEHEEAIFAAAQALKSLINTCLDESLIKQGVEQITINKNSETRKSKPTVIEKVCATIESLLDYHYSAVWDVVFQVVSTLFDKLGNYSFYFMRGTLKNLADMQGLPDEDFPYWKQHANGIKHFGGLKIQESPFGLGYTSRSFLHECLGSALGAMGPETFLSLLPLKLEADDLSEVNVWLFPLLKQYTVGAHLSFFTETVLSMVGLIKKKSQKLELEGRIISARSADALVYSLWSLLPSFCNYPLDTAESFKDLEEALGGALREECDIRGIICSALQILVQQNKRVMEEQDDLTGTEVGIAEQHAIAHYTPQVASDNLRVLRSSAHNLLHVLSGILLESSKDDGGLLQSTIREFASIADKVVIKRIFLKTMQKLLNVTRKATKPQNSRGSNSMQIDDSSNDLRARLFDLAVSLLPGLNDEEINVLYSAVKPALQDVEGLIQKKAYKVLSIILQRYDGFLTSRLGELLQLMIDVLPSCHFSAKRYRLDCLYCLIVHAPKVVRPDFALSSINLTVEKQWSLDVDSEQRRNDILTSFLTEIILALKEASKKTRNRAYDVLVQIGHTYGDEENGGKKENLYQFFNMVAGGLALESPHMISAAMKGVARLAYEFSDLVSTAYKLLPSTFLLLQRKNREIIKANLGLLKVLVAKSQAEGLQMYLGSMVEGLLRWQDDTKNHFKAKVCVDFMLYLGINNDCLSEFLEEISFFILALLACLGVGVYAVGQHVCKQVQKLFAALCLIIDWKVKHILEMLVKKCGLDAVKAVMPEEHMKLLTNIRKIKEQGERKHAASSEETKSHMSRASTSRISGWNHTKIFSDFSYGETGDSDGEYTDTKTVSGRRSKFSSQLKSKALLRSEKSLPEDIFDQLEDEPLDLLDRHRTKSALRSSADRKRKQESDDEPEIDSEGRLIVREGGKPKKEKPSDPDSDARSEAGSFKSVNSRKAQKRRKTSDSGWAYTGNEYASKKAGGDVKRKDKLEPYAYWPLDRKMMSRRPEHRAAARKGMASVVKLTKKLEGKSASTALSMKLIKSNSQKKGNKRKSR